ncbi:hypothetical protein NOR_05948 [Metarhizium rileyi]|uniref:Uncharacterized protein n=1 Tax=Metarhizium rileyi (strain RCEF 4871) TaxID=1649241 RepID=A0A167BEH1_METRR|nr:hypothetical protein NOR_05948 [Metarhizium rileyi RCEF 4871]
MAIATITNPSYAFDELPSLTVNLGALTTTFTPADNCAVLTLVGYFERAAEDYVTAHVTWMRGITCSSYSTARKAITSCFPERWGPAYNNIDTWAGPNAVYPVYSPGLACPKGYVTGCTMVPPNRDATNVVTSSAATVSKWGALAKGETAFGCCPIGYSCHDAYSCVSTPPISTTVTADMDRLCRPGETSIGRTSSTLIILEKIAPTIVAAQVVLVQGADNSTSSTTNTSLPAKTSSPPQEATPPASLSIAAKAAIGAALPLVLIMLLLAGYMLYRRRNRKNKAAASSDQNSNPLGLNKPELDATPSPLGLSLSPGSELDGTPRISALSHGPDSSPDPTRPSELQGSIAARAVGPMCELPGDDQFARTVGEPQGTLGISSSPDDKVSRGALPNRSSKPSARHAKDR